MHKIRLIIKPYGHICENYSKYEEKNIDFFSFLTFAICQSRQPRDSEECLFTNELTHEPRERSESRTLFEFLPLPTPQIAAKTIQMS